VYDGILKSRNLPYLPDIRTRGHSMRAVDIMDASVVEQRQFLTRKITYQDLVSTLKACPNLPHLAVVDNHENLLLLGVVTRSTLEELIENYRKEVEDTDAGSSREWHSNLPKPLKKAVRSSVKFTNDEHVRADSRRFHKANTMVDEEFEEGQREAERLITVPYEYSPVQLQPSTPLPSIHLLFITLRLRVAYVTSNGRLAGSVTRSQVKTIIDDSSVFEWLAV